MTSQRRLDQYFSQSKRKREEIPAAKRRKLNDDVEDVDFTEVTCEKRKVPSRVYNGIVSLDVPQDVPITSPLVQEMKPKEDSATANNPTVLPSIQKERFEAVKKVYNAKDSSGPNIQPQLQHKEKQALDAVVMKQKLAKCGKLAELQERLAKLRKCTASVQSSKKARESTLKNVSTESDKISGENAATDCKTLPAYQRFHHLASANATTNLTLPYKYKLLDEVFQSVDTVVSMLHNRQELCTFSKLKPAVQEMLRKTLEMRHLAQLKTVFPLAYNFGKTVFKNNLQDITVTPNFNFDTVGEVSEKTSVSDSNGNFDERPELDNCSPETQRMSPSLLLVRKNIFHARLLEVVKQQHKAFLTSLDPPINLPNDSINRWHPRFRLDEVPDILEAQLPQLDNSKKCTTANEVLLKVKGLYGSKIENALQTVASKIEQNNVHSVDVAPPEKVNANLKGIPLSLLQKIRAKEAEKLKREMTRDGKVDRRLAMISRLPEIARILRIYFISEKKAAIIMDDVIQKLSESCRTSLPQGDVKEHVALLAEMAPTYVSVIAIRHVEYVKVNKQTDLNTIIEKLDQAKKSLV